MKDKLIKKKFIRHLNINLKYTFHQEAFYFCIDYNEKLNNIYKNQFETALCL